MIEIILRRLGFMLLTMLIVSMAIFIISEVVPVDVARNILGQFATEQGIAALREQLGLNCPTGVRYVIWLAGDDWIPPVRDLVGESVLPSGCTPEGLERRGLLRGDMGISTQYGGPVAPFLMRRLKNSLVLAGISFVAIMPISLLLGAVAGLREGGFLDRFISIASLVTTSSPTFATGVILIVIFSRWLGILPGISIMMTDSSAFESLEKLVMPIAVLFLAEAGYVARMTRASMVDVMRQPYVRTAILKGLPRWKVILRHALPNALLAPITVIMLHVNWLIGGVVVVEVLFGFPGLGNALLTASLNKDLYIIEAGSLLMTFVATATQLVADIIYVYLNPRIRFS
ncbi:MAG: ABC transporter permease [Anaerolineae bacterium]|nr:ABC transporter permease [Anaerolineae bacterium]